MPAPAPSRTLHPREVTAPSEYGVLRWLVLATFLVILNETIVVNAIPRLMSEFDITARAAQWLSTAFMLTMAVVIPTTGWLLQRVTTRQAFLLAMGVFTVGTLLAAVAPTYSVLLAGRVVQAMGTAVMMPLLMTTIMTVVRQEDRGRVMGNVTLAISVAPALGPAVSGVTLQLGSWRWIFGVVLPVGVAIAVLALRGLRNVGEVVPGRIDWASVALAVAGFGPLVYGLSQLGAEDAAAPPGLVLGVGVGAVALFVRRQLRLQRAGVPLLDLRTLRYRSYAVALGVLSVGFMAMIGSMILLPMYLQEVRGLTELETGLLVMPGGLAMGLLGPTVGRLFDRFGARPLVIPGAAAIMVALAGFTQVGLQTPVWQVLAAHVLLMVGLAGVFTPAFTLGLGVLPRHLYSHGSSLLGTAQQVAAAIGTAVVVAVMSWRASGLAEAGTPAGDALVAGMRWGFGVGAVLGVVVLVLAVALGGRVVRDPR